MEFFVGIENKTFYHWQIELLLENFNQLNLQDKLLVANVNCEDKIENQYTKNLTKHKRIYQISKLNYDTIYPKFAILKALKNAITYKLINQPLTYLESSSILLKPEEIKTSSEPSIIYVQDLIYEKMFFDILIPDWFKFDEKINFEKGFPKIGCAIILNKVPQKFFERLISICEKLIKYQLLKSNCVNEFTDKLAWAITISEFSTKIKVEEKELAAFLHTNDDNVFLDYTHGIPPFFHKSMYKFEPPRYFAFGEPFETLVNYQISSNVKLLADIAQKNY